MSISPKPILALILARCLCAIPVGLAGQIEFQQAHPDLPPMPAPAQQYLHEWLYLGPFWSEESDPEHPVIWQVPPLDVADLDQLESPVQIGDATFSWQVLAADQFSPKIPLAEFPRRGSHAVVYVGMYVDCLSPGANHLLIGSDDGFEAWLNQERVYQVQGERAWQQDENVVPVDLRSGRNLLVLRIDQAERGWEFSARFTQPRGVFGSIAAEPQSLELLPEKVEPPRIVIGPYLQNPDSTGFTVMWETDIPCLGQMEVWSTGEGATTEAPSPSLRLKAQSPFPCRLHQARVNGLQAQTPYSCWVKACDPKRPDMCTVTEGLSIRTLSPPDSPRAVRFLAYGDTRTNVQDHAFVASAMGFETGIDFVVHSGDLVGDGSVLTQWPREFFRPAGAMMNRFALFPVLGNHENNSRFFFAYFDLPGNERWYSFDCGPVTMIGIDSTSDFSPGSEQGDWLLQTLQTHKQRPWKIICTHYPTYTSGPHGRLGEDGRAREKPIRMAQEVFPALAAQYNVQLFIHGHDHCYERSQAGGVTYMTTGAGGAPLYNKVDHAERQNPHSQVFYSGLSYALITATTAQLDIVVKNPLGETVDNYVLTRSQQSN